MAADQAPGVLLSDGGGHGRGRRKIEDEAGGEARLCRPPSKRFHHLHGSGMGPAGNLVHVVMTSGREERGRFKERERERL